MLPLWTEILILALAMSLFCVLPLHSAMARRYSQSLFLAGTGAMFGICFFDLLPDVFELGGSRSLYVIGLVWLVYSGIHLFHLRQHNHAPASEPGSEHAHDHLHSHGHDQGSSLFFGSLVAHCFASGMLLTVSRGLSAKIAGTVFAALLAHKLYESLLVSSILMNQKTSPLHRNTVIGVYTAALPAGAVVTVLFQGSITPATAVLISSVAVGTLLGCLIFDFLMPSLQHLQRQWGKVGWLVAGFLLTQFVMRSL